MIFINTKHFKYCSHINVFYNICIDASAVTLRPSKQSHTKKTTYAVRYSIHSAQPVPALPSGKARRSPSLTYREQAIAPLPPKQQDDHIGLSMWDRTDPAARIIAPAMRSTPLGSMYRT